MNKILNYKEFQTKKITEQHAELNELEYPIEDHVDKVVEITDTGFITVNQDGEKTIINNDDLDLSMTTKVEEIPNNE